MKEKEFIEKLIASYPALAESLQHEGFTTMSQLKSYVQGKEYAEALGDTLVLFVVRELSDFVENGEIPAETVAEQMHRAAKELEAIEEAFVALDVEEEDNQCLS